MLSLLEATIMGESSGQSACTSATRHDQLDDSRDVPKSVEQSVSYDTSASGMASKSWNSSEGNSGTSAVVNRSSVGKKQAQENGGQLIDWNTIANSVESLVGNVNAAVVSANAAAEKLVAKRQHENDVADTTEEEGMEVTLGCGGSIAQETTVLDRMESGISSGTQHGSTSPIDSAQLQTFDDRRLNRYGFS